MNAALNVRPKFLGWLAFFLALPVALHAGWDYVEARRLRMRVAEITQRGEPVSMDQLKPSAALRGEAAASAQHLRAAAALAANWAPRAYDGPGAPRSLMGTAPEDWSAEHIQQARQLIEENAIALQLSDRAMSLGFVSLPPGLSYSYQFSELWQLWRLASLRTRLLAADRDRGAVDALERQLQLREAIDRAHPELSTGWFSRELAVDVRLVLEGAPATSQAWIPIASSLAAIDRDDGPKRTLLMQRAQLLAGGSPHVRDRSGRHSLVPWDWVRRPLDLHTLNRILDRMTAFIADAGQPWPEKLNRFPAPAPAIHGERRHFESLYEAHTADVVNMEALDIAMIRSARLAVAVARYRHDHGSWPSNVDDLVPPYLPARLIDPYSGQSLKFTITDPVFVAYSIGTNRRDDGGNVQFQKAPAPQFTLPLDFGIAVTPTNP